MKILKITPLFIVGLLFIWSCSDFLNIAPRESISEPQFYITEDDFDQALIGAYAPLQALYRGDWIVTEFRSDHTHFVYNTAQRGPKPDEDVATFLVESNNRNMSNKWNANYLIISRTNTLIEKIAQADLTESVKANILGQSHFLRAFAYFDLIKNFGGVPLFLESVSSYGDSFKPRESKDMIVSQVISDLTSSMSYLREQQNPTSNKASFASAATLLAYVHMTDQRWAEAEALLNQVAGLDYQLLEDYRQIFSPTNEGNAEMIFEVEYLDDTGRGIGSDLIYQFIPDLLNPAEITGVSPSQRRSSGAGFNVPTPDLVNLFDQTNDLRFEASIAFYTGNSPIQGVSYENMPYIRKYLFPHARCCETGQNFPVFRYAEVLLLLAESLNEQGKTTEALPHLNQVRERAGLSAVTSSDQSSVREAILLERQLELAFENKRWHDLVRTGRGVEVMNAFGAKVKQNPQAYYYPSGVGPIPSAFQVTTDHYLYPIPITEININPELQQNPGY